MSVNYHAYQNRGYLLGEHEADAEQWYEKFNGYDPERIAGILGLQRDDDYLYIPYFDDLYRLVLTTGRLERKIKPGEPDREIRHIHTGEPDLPEQRPSGRSTAKEERTWTENVFFNEGMALYHVLLYTADTPRYAGVWVPGSALDGVVSRNPAVNDPLLAPFAGRFSGRCGAFRRACEAFGGTDIKKGDAGYQFRAFSFLPMQVIFWDRDEDFDAQVQVLFDQYVTDYIHFETTGCLISDLFEKLCVLDA
ncbi:MAG: DUF3786 domain-containing protein [Blautia sp.]|nr:DUF3786 domain-containing protein [Blautia sp.]